jgi:hypothetical protein
VAHFINAVKSFMKTPAGIATEVIVYAVMLILIFVFFTGNGQFIYEAY